MYPHARIDFEIDEWHENAHNIMLHLKVGVKHHHVLSLQYRKVFTNPLKYHWKEIHAALKEQCLLSRVTSDVCFFSLSYIFQIASNNSVLYFFSLFGGKIPKR